MKHYRSSIPHNAEERVVSTGSSGDKKYRREYILNGEADGESIGSYTMKHGTGLDLWRCKASWTHGRVFLSEARFVKDGKWHGFEWWLNEDQKSVHAENHFWENLQHGIERRWNSQGRLSRGYPRYWVNNKRVTKREYLRACAGIPNLPRFRESDNQPRRKFPPEVLAAIKLTDKPNECPGK